jgi:hypothetical protein
MPRHSIERDARGRVANISGTCDAETCPEEVIDDDGGVVYKCADTGEVLAEEDAVGEPEVPDDRKPATTDDLTGSDRRRRR